MQVILFKNIDNLGMQGEVVNVKNGYFRNYLGPRGMAVEASDATLKRLEVKRQRLRAEAEKQVQEAEGFAQQLENAEVKFVMKSPDGKKLFGSVHENEIADKLIEQGFNIERRQVVHEPIKETGTYRVKVSLVGQVEAHINVIVEAEEVKTDMQKRMEAEAAEEEAAAAEGESETAEATEAPEAEAAPAAEEEKSADA